jgi:hypothetical protein
MEVSGQLQAPVTLLPEKETPKHICQEAEWAPETVWTPWRREKTFNFFCVRDWRKLHNMNSSPIIIIIIIIKSKMKLVGM